jgi:hypothetical protein
MNEKNTHGCRNNAISVSRYPGKRRQDSHSAISYARPLASFLQNIQIRDEPKVYMQRAQSVKVDSATSTIKNFPNPPTGASVAPKRPPTFSPCSKASFQDGMAGAIAAIAAPIMWEGTYGMIRISRNKIKR